LCDANDVGLVSAGAVGAFGFPQRYWKDFTGGDIVLAALGEREVRHHLRQFQSFNLDRGTAVECAERLLLLKLDLTHPEAMLQHLGSSNLAVLRRRLRAVGLRPEGNSVECASRLLMLRDSMLETLAEEHIDCVDMPPLELVDDSSVDISQVVPFARTSEVAHCMLFMKIFALLIILGSIWNLCR
jgi:hypothetical protein